MQFMNFINLKDGDVVAASPFVVRFGLSLQLELVSNTGGTVLAAAAPQRFRAERPREQ